MSLLFINKNLLLNKTTKTTKTTKSTKSIKTTVEEVVLKLQQEIDLNNSSISSKLKIRTIKTISNKTDLFRVPNPKISKTTTTIRGITDSHKRKMQFMTNMWIKSKNHTLILVEEVLLFIEEGVVDLSKIETNAQKL